MKIINFFKLLRPKFQIPSISSFIVGITLALILIQPVEINYWKIIVGLLIVGPLTCGGSLSINQYFDYELDKSAGKETPLLKYNIPKNRSLETGLILLSLGVILSITINIYAFLATLIATVLSLMYHIPPIRLKETTYIDSISNGVVYSFPPVLVGWSIISPVKWDAIIISIPLLLLFTAGHMLLAIPDIEEDKKFGINSTTSALGIKKTIKISLILFTAAYALIPIKIYLGLYPILTISTLIPASYTIKRLFELHRNPELPFKKLKKGILAVGIFFIISLIIPLLQTSL